MSNDRILVLLYQYLMCPLWMKSSCNIHFCKFAEVVFGIIITKVDSAVNSGIFDVVRGCRYKIGKFMKNTCNYGPLIISSGQIEVNLKFAKWSVTTKVSLKG